MNSGEHGPDELYEKFHVYKAADEVCDDPNPYNSMAKYPFARRIGADGEFLFVLRPETNDKAAQMALAEYARCCEGSYPGLAASIVRELTRIDARVKAIMQMGECDEDTAYKIMRNWAKEPSRCPHCGAMEGTLCKWNGPDPQPCSNLLPEF
jgi:predicted Zn-ribbon and HTH transcriptional regulator